MRQVSWSIGGETIPYFIGFDCADAIARKVAALSPAPDQLLVVADKVVWERHGSRFESAFESKLSYSLILMPSMEQAKTLATVEKIMAAAFGARATGNSVVIAMGGGIIGNTAGLAAALLFRGIRLVHLPTTLLAMHDSVTSLKQGVNYDGAKNLVGTYYRPDAILVDLFFLETLSVIEIRSGFAELVKNALILCGTFGEALEKLRGNPISINPRDWEPFIELGVTAKQRILRDDPHERGSALIFEYGHTVGHALELTFQDNLTHGDAIAWGMRCAGWIALEMGFMNDTMHHTHKTQLSMLGSLPRARASFSIEEVLWRVGRDNKRGRMPSVTADEFPFVLLHEPGRVVSLSNGIPLTSVPRSVLNDALAELKSVWDS